MTLKLLISYGIFIYCSTFANMVMASPLSKVNRNRKFGHAWNGMINVVSTIPEIQDIFAGRATIRELSWSQINKIFVKALKEIDHMWKELEEAQNSITSHSTNYIVSVCLLDACSGIALILSCLHFAKLRIALIKFRRGIPINFEGARKSLQELLKLRRLSIGDLEANMSKPNHNMAYAPYPNIQPTIFCKSYLPYS